VKIDKGDLDAERRALLEGLDDFTLPEFPEHGELLEGLGDIELGLPRTSADVDFDALLGEFPHVDLDALFGPWPDIDFGPWP
jgi:hypothetical protein